MFEARTREGGAIVIAVDPGAATGKEDLTVIRHRGVTVQCQQAVVLRTDVAPLQADLAHGARAIGEQQACIAQGLDFGTRKTATQEACVDARSKRKDRRGTRIHTIRRVDFCREFENFSAAGFVTNRGVGARHREHNAITAVRHRNGATFADDLAIIVAQLRTERHRRRNVEQLARRHHHIAVEVGGQLHRNGARQTGLGLGEGDGILDEASGQSIALFVQRDGFVQPLQGAHRHHATLTLQHTVHGRRTALARRCFDGG